MGHKNKKSLKQQVDEELRSMLAIGQSKHVDKVTDDTSDKIYSYGTFNAYQQQCIAFAVYCKSQHKAKNLADCRQYVNEYLQASIDKDMSPYTIKLQASALAKLFHCSTKDFISTPPRERKHIKRSRLAVARDNRYKDGKNDDFIRFCRCTGLRRREITALRGDCLQMKDGKYYIFVKNGKGGRKRLSEIIGSEEDITFVIEKMQEVQQNKVFAKIPDIDIHALRAEYAKSVYEKYARNRNDYKSERMILYHNRLVTTYTDKSKVQEYYNPDGTLKKGFTDVRTAYHCRDDKKNICYDRLALLRCSQNLGHNRASVVADHYLWF
ncbi:MAG: hypothetical protein IKM66_01070 [Clostridia bacterium]|nr:hypothetical protein [Clostridia bacterium]